MYDLTLFMLRAVCGLALWFAFLFGMAGFLAFCGVRPKDRASWALTMAELAHRLVFHGARVLLAMLGRVLRQPPLSDVA